MSATNSTESRTLDIIAETISVELFQLNKDTDLTESFGADSLDFMELAIELEHEFKIELPDRLGDNTKTVEQIILLVKKLVEEKIVEDDGYITVHGLESK